MRASEGGIAADLERVRRIILAGLAGCPARVYLFGSRASGQARSASDIDVAVWPLAPLPEGTLAAIREALEETTIPYTIDLVDLRDADASFRARVIAEGVPWHEPSRRGE
ncbi:type VII toxin-antitoxin system MntA family adenylyltransferase antitoxin [Truepera radiovictrix]|uniref:DNA polymerase beta domain protein region n=1 Tax=Truepera radiovictrix (strain DSM 17093 / CIP 108686 / LMG 22925 / RQ-24) TaxID=649638 RepID=D7CQJ6_TRURR|nr:nucleotidyltransferase domain-containing protein [Truepera radiovictrix]ADI14980.1 DNA polymerase beta domain protein region [Truepera radiovictrix DSM 17093]WMT56465.1 nucleotidyltransferase domain-containing protein [Truepera radiovictrix]